MEDSLLLSRPLLVKVLRVCVCEVLQYAGQYVDIWLKPKSTIISRVTSGHKHYFFKFKNSPLELLF